MKLFPILSGAATDRTAQRPPQADARLDRSKVVRVAWFLGPRDSSWNGVSQYSLVLIRALTGFGEFRVDAIDIPAKPRSLKRYWWQFVVYPLRALHVARAYDVVLIYQEDLSFLIPLVRLGGGRVCIVFHHARRPEGTGSAVERLKNWYIGLTEPLIARADLVFVPSAVTARELLKTVSIPPDRLHVLPNTFDDRYIALDGDAPTRVRTQAREAWQQRFGWSVGDAFVLLNVGSDETRKNTVTLFRALATMARKNIVVIRVGAPINVENRLKCEAIAAESGMQAYFLAQVGDDDLRCLYQGVDALVSPSLHEGFGRTVIEAQSAGIPVIASDLQVYRETMRDSFLAVRAPLDPVAWTTEIARLVENQSLLNELIQRGKKNALRFTCQSVCSQLIDDLRCIARTDGRNRRL